MPMNGYSIGTDISLCIVGPNGPLVFNKVTEFQSKPKTKDDARPALDGVTRHLRFPQGWEGSFNLDRQDSTMDDWWSQVEANYYAGVNEVPISITETKREVSGAVSQYRYQGVMLTPDDMGTWKGDEAVVQKLKFVAERRIKVS